MQSLVDQMFGTPSAAAQPGAGIEKTAEANFVEGLGAPSIEDFDALDDETLDQTIADLEAQAAAAEAQANPQAELDKVASSRLFGEVACHSFLHEEEAIKIAMVNGNCRSCKETPIDRSAGGHPSLCPSCNPSA